MLSICIMCNDWGHGDHFKITVQCAHWQLSILGLRWLERQNEVAQFKIKIDLLKVRSLIPMFGLTGPAL